MLVPPFAYRGPATSRSSGHQRDWASRTGFHVGLRRIRPGVRAVRSAQRWLGDRFGPRQVCAESCVVVVFIGADRLVFPFTLDSGSLPSRQPLLLVLIRSCSAPAKRGPMRSWACPCELVPYARPGAQGYCGRLAVGAARSPGLLRCLPGVWLARGLSLVRSWAFCGSSLPFFFRNTPAAPGRQLAERALIDAGANDAERTPPVSWRAMLASPTLWFSADVLCSNAGWCSHHLGPEILRQGSGLSEARCNSRGAGVFCGIACLLEGSSPTGKCASGPAGGTLPGGGRYGLGAGFFLLALGTNEPLWRAACARLVPERLAMAVNWSTGLDIGHRYSGTIAGCMNGVVIRHLHRPACRRLLARNGRWELALAFSAACSPSPRLLLFIIRATSSSTPAADHRRLQEQGVIG